MPRGAWLRRAGRLSSTFALGAVGCAFGCNGEELDPVLPPPLCDTGVAVSALSLPDRMLVGEASPYPADGVLRASEEVLARSMAARRAVGWAVAGRAVEPVAIMHETAAGQEIPRFQTWYDADDLRRIFLHLYEPLSEEDKRARTRFDEAAIDEAFAWNTNAVLELPAWSIERYLEHVSAIDTEGELHGVGGISRVAYSPGAVRHILRSYGHVLACRDVDPPPARLRGDTTSIEIGTFPLNLEACSTRALAPHWVDAGESLLVELTEGVGANLLTRVEGAVTCRSDSECRVAGPATIAIEVEATGATQARVLVTREEQAPVEWAACLDGPFPLDAAVVKADYRRADFEFEMPAFDTSGEALADMFSAVAPTWATASEEDPGSDSIFTLTLPGGESYRLAGLHVMTKELEHWIWASLFWSNTPQSDFGEDRPASLIGPWSNYKLCVATSFAERDEDPSSTFEDTHPSLAASLRATTGDATWCSNPYLEEGHGNAATNCIGCHQHAGSGNTTEDVLALPAFGVAAARNNFPTDYSFAIVQGDTLSAMFAEAELYYLGPSP